MKKIVILSIFLVCFLATAESRATDAFCGGSIVSVGDTNAEVIMKCGEPDWRESHKQSIVEKLEADAKRKTFVTVEEWTYNFGPDVLMRIVTLKNGRVVDVRLGGYGYAKERSRQVPCSEQIVSLGDSAGDVTMKCGKPAWKEAREEELREKLDETKERKAFVTVEEWTYNFGPDKFIRIFTFKNGKLVDIRTGGYGYEEMKKEEKR
jgi:Protein of unknown function (DUF2845)